MRAVSISRHAKLILSVILLPMVLTWGCTGGGRDAENLPPVTGEYLDLDISLDTIPSYGGQTTTITVTFENKAGVIANESICITLSTAAIGMLVPGPTGACGYVTDENGQVEVDFLPDQGASGDVTVTVTVRDKTKSKIIHVRKGGIALTAFPVSIPSDGVTESELIADVQYTGLPLADVPVCFETTDSAKAVHTLTSDDNDACEAGEVPTGCNGVCYVTDTAGQVIVYFLAEEEFSGDVSVDAWFLDATDIDYFDSVDLSVHTEIGSVTIVSDDYDISVSGLVPPRDDTAGLTATVEDLFGQEVPDVIVYFATDLGTVDPAFGVTNAAGRATTTLVSGTESGMATVSATVDDKSDTAEVDIVPGPVFAVTVNATPTTIPADGGSTSTVTAAVEDVYGNAVDGEPVDFSSTITDTWFTEPTVETDADGDAVATLNAGVIAGETTITATADGVSNTTVVTLTTPIGDPASIVAVSTTSPVIGIKGSSDIDSTTIIFEVRDDMNQPVEAGHAIAFEIQGGGLGGGEFLNPETGTTDMVGQVSVTLTSGTIAGTVRIYAYWAANPAVVSEGVDIAIHGGLPYGERFSLAADPLNLIGLKELGLTAGLTAFVLDKYSNDVPDGTSVHFRSDYSGLNGSDTTIEGQAGNTLTSQGPLPPDGTVKVRASAESGIMARTLCVEFDPTDSDVVYAGSDGGGIFKSTDGGTNWDWIGRFETGLTNGIVRDIAVDPNLPSVVYAGTDGGVFRSIGGGGDWTEMNGAARVTGEPLGIIGALPATLDLAYPSSMNRPRTNLFLHDPDSGDPSETIYYDYISSDEIYLDSIPPATDSWVGMEVSVDYDIWAPLPSIYRINAIAIDSDPADPMDSSRIYVGTAGAGVYKSFDGGYTWTAMNIGLLDQDVLSLAIDTSTTEPDTVLYAGTNGGGVFTSTDGAGHWAASNTGLSGTIVQALAVDPVDTARLYAGTQSEGIFLSDDSAATWTEPAIDVDAADVTNVDVRDIAINPATTTLLYAATYGGGAEAAPTGGVFQSIDGGVNWAATAELDNSYVHAVAVAESVARAEVVFAGSEERNISRSTDAGASWEVANDRTPNRNNIFTTGELLFTGDTVVTILPIGDDDLNPYSFPVIPYQYGQSFIYTVSDFNGNPLTIGTSITATASSGTLRGDTAVSVSEDFAPTQFGLTLTNEDALPEEESVVIELSIFSPNGNVDVFTTGVFGIDLSISPSEKDVALGEKILFRAAGGREPYAWSWTSGADVGVGYPEDFLYWQAGLLGPAIVTVTDDVGDEALAIINVSEGEGLAIDPATLLMIPYQYQTFEVSGGSGVPENYEWSTDCDAFTPGEQGCGEPETQSGGTSFLWRAPLTPVASEILIIVEDTLTAESAFAVITMEPLSVTPTTAVMAGGVSQDFEASGGSGNGANYAWSATAGTPTSQVGGEGFTWFAPVNYSAGDIVVTIEVEDTLTGETVSATATVLPGNPLNIFPKTGTVVSEEILAFSATGGSEEPNNYTWNVTPPLGTPTHEEATDIFEWTAPYNNTGSAIDITVTVSDDVSGQNESAIVTVTPLLNLEPMSVTLLSGGSQLFDGSGGSTNSDNYSWSATAGSPREQSGGDSFNWSAPDNTGTDDLSVTITLRDGATGDHLTAAVTVIPELDFDPRTITVDSEASQSFTAWGGSGDPDNYVWSIVVTGGVPAGYTGYPPIQIGGASFVWTAPLNDYGDEITLELTLQDTVTTDSVTGTVLVLQDTGP